MVTALGRQPKVVWHCRVLEMFARELWMRIESFHAVTYFSPESIEAARAAGLRGFWMGYFGFRAAPLGRVSAEAVEAVFANFETAMVRRSIPDAWNFADPSDLISMRATAAATTLRRIAPEVEDLSVRVNSLLEAAIAAGQPIGRPLFTANRAITRLDDPVERFWQNCTTLREHRGDGHVAALTAAGIDGCQAHLLLSADQAVAPEVFFENRGWSPKQQRAAAQALTERGLIDGASLTEKGQALRLDIEATTDSLAAALFDGLLAGSDRDELLRTLTPCATAVVRSGTLPFPNPMGLPKLAAEQTLTPTAKDPN
jgi:hypothetical protein